MITLSLIACVLGVVGVLVADWFGIARLEYVCKPLAALAFILAGIAWGALDSAYGQWILLGLICGALGDVLLLPKRTGPAFLLGMLAFLVGHLAYAMAFWRLPQHPGMLAGVGLLAALAAIWLLRWMLPRVPTALRGPVLAYHVVILAMVALACGAVAAGASWSIAVGAVAFAASDIAVARNRFIAPGFVNRAWGIPLYFSAQMLIASTVA